MGHDVMTLVKRLRLWEKRKMGQKALFLDRDGIINVDHGYVGSADRFQFQDGIFALLRYAQGNGYRLVVITNQAGVARGYYTADDFAALTCHMLAEFVREGIMIDLVMCCFEHPEGKVAPYTRQSYWRKPNPGMILDAAQRLNLDLEQSVFLGDQPTDMQAARAAGVGSRLLLNPSDAAGGDGVIAVNNLSEVERYLRSLFA